MVWKRVKVGELGRIVTGKTPKTTEKDNYNGKIMFVTPSDNMDDKYIYLTGKTITEKGKNSVKGSIIPAGSVCVSCIGSNLGKVVITTEECVTNQQINSVVVDREKYDVDFVYYAMLVLGKELNFHSKTSTAVPIVNKSSFSSYEISCPPLDVQKQIASVLSALDSKIEKNTEVNKNLEQQAQAYFLDLFVTNPDPNWQSGTLSDLGTVVGGGTPSKKHPEYYIETGIPWITPKDLSIDKSKFISRGENDITELGFSNSSATKMPAGTILFSSRAPIGYIAIALNTVTTNQGFKSVIPNTNVGSAFMYFFLKQALPTIEGMASGSTFKEISGSGMKSVPAVIPDDETLHKYNEFCQPLFEQQVILEAENRRLSGIRDALLPKLMSGEIDVSNIDL